MDWIKITCVETNGFTYPRICFYWIADSQIHCNISATACLTDWIKNIGYGSWMVSKRKSCQIDCILQPMKSKSRRSTLTVNSFIHSASESDSVG
ncbi:hypothetical protein Y032_0164g3535 [Ancylostoma ceylanicum]|uniref:Uncharacterized protein n=1 Tax=Ancylostoma ceylanicum TaxID=53326 RepID=A0A016SXH7_9BILA|nr:hypothetical protein Y032_0164g3535 [Ancylostoma ceylanicum]